MIIGITGSISSGKSFILNIIKNLGYDIYQTDTFTLEAYEDDFIKEIFNLEFNCLKDNRIDKSILRNLIDKDIKVLNIINNIIHPFILRKIKNIDHENKLIFIEIPLLFETNFDKICDYTISISMDETLRDQMLKNRNPDKYDFYKLLEKQQFTTEQKNRFSDFVIYNNLDNENLIKQIKTIIDSLNKVM